MYVSRLLFRTIPGKTNEVDGGGIEELFAGQLDDYLGKLAHHYGHSGSSGGSVR